jgi:hypothetical protein
VSVTLDLPDDVLKRLTAEAERRGIAVSDVVADLAGTLPSVGSAVQRELAFVGAGASQAGITPRIDALLDEGFGR